MSPHAARRDRLSVWLLTMLVVAAACDRSLSGRQRDAEPNGSRWSLKPEGQVGVTLNLALEEWLLDSQTEQFARDDGVYRVWELICDRTTLTGTIESHCQLFELVLRIRDEDETFQDVGVTSTLYDPRRGSLQVSNLSLEGDTGFAELATVGGPRLGLTYSGDEVFVTDYEITGAGHELRFPADSYDVPLPPFRLKALRPAR